jgi:hypothetical protein
MKNILYIGGILVLLLFAVSAYAQDISTESFNQGDECSQVFKFVIQVSKDGHHYEATNTFEASEDIYLVGFDGLTKVDIYITADRNWSDGDAIDPYVLKKSNKFLSLIPLNIGPLPPGKYDVIVDKNKNGVYNKKCDAIDGAKVMGFEVLPELATAGLVGLGIISMAGYFALQRKK